MSRILNMAQGGLITLLIIWADDFQVRWRQIGWFFLVLSILAVRDAINHERMIKAWVDEYRRGGIVREVIRTDA